MGTGKEKPAPKVRGRRGKKSVLGVQLDENFDMK